LKQRQDNATARMASDSVGVFGTADPDFIGFVTAPFQQMKPVTVQSGKGSYGTIALLPEQQHATLRRPLLQRGNGLCNGPGRV
jgi:hypothetical protein